MRGLHVTLIKQGLEISRSLLDLSSKISIRRRTSKKRRLWNCPKIRHSLYWKLVVVPGLWRWLCFRRTNAVNWIEIFSALLLTKTEVRFF